MSGRPAKGMKYLHMGPWPGFVGLCFDERVFAAEIKRLGIEEKCDFLAHDTAAATLHHFTSKSGQIVYLMTVGSTRNKSREMVAGLVAHEAMHIIQGMQKDFAGGKTLGDEAEAYLVQMIVQETLQTLWKSNKVRRTEPMP
jgi:hypothetical protein